MALAKYGGIISELRGKEAGVIFSRNAYGSYMKQKVSPVNPQTQNQLGQRTLMGNLAQTWAGLTSGQKESWDNLGAQVTRVNRFGDTTYYTGFSLFMKLNRNLVLCGSAALDEAPAVSEMPVLAVTAFAADVSDTAINITFTPTPVPANHKVFFYLTNNILTGRRFVKNYYRLVNKYAAAGASPADVYADWLAYYGNALVAGAKLFLKAKLVNSATGFEGVPATSSCTVIA